jgi:hypothetical protein
MLEQNQRQTHKAQTVMQGPTETLWDRASLAVGDWLSDKLMIEETFNEVEGLGLEGGNMGPQDRARHLLWMSKLGAEYGPVAAGLIGGAKELENLFLDPWKQLRFMGEEDSDVIRERQFDALKETGRDFQTNMFALRNQPYDEEGNRRPYTPEELLAIVGDLEVTESPLVQRQIAEAPSGLLRNDREVTTTKYPPLPPEPSAPVFEEALPEGMRLAPGDSGQFPEFDLPMGAPDPHGDGTRSWINPENRRRVMKRRDI